MPNETNTQATSPLDAALGGAQTGALDGALGSLRGNMAARDSLAGRDTPSGLDLLLRPESLAKLGLAVAGGLSGNEDLQALGAGLGIGTLEGAGQQANDAAMQQQQQFKQLSTTIEKQQQQIVSLLQSQPGLFVGEDNENAVTPEQLGRLSGLGINMSPAAMVHRLQATQRTKDTVAFYGDMFVAANAAGNELGMAQSIRGMSDTMELGLEDGDIRQLISTEPDQIPGALFSVLDPASVLSTLKEAHNTGKSIWDPEVFALLPKKDKDDLPTFDSKVEILANDGMALAMQKFAMLGPEDTTNDGQDLRTFYRTHQAEFWDDMLADHPDMLLALKQKYTAARQGDRLKELDLEATLGATKSYQQYQMIPLFAEQDPTKRAQLLANIVNSSSINMSIMDRASTTAAAYRQAASMTPEELQAEIDRLTPKEDDDATE